MILCNKPSISILLRLIGLRKSVFSIVKYVAQTFQLFQTKMVDKNTELNDMQRKDIKFLTKIDDWMKEIHHLQAILLPLTVFNSFNFYYHLKDSFIYQLFDILKYRMQNITPNDRYRRDYAVVAKHILCSSTEISLYQIQRFALSGPYNKDGITVGFMYVWQHHLKEKTQLIGNAILASLGGIMTGGIGLAVAVALAGLLYVFDTAKNETIESKVKTVIEKSRINSIEAYLKAYQSCFQSVQSVQNYCKLIQTSDYLIKLESSLNEVYTILTDQGYEQRPLDVNLNICALFYKLAKLVIQLHCLINPTCVEDKLEGLKSQHGQIKKKMVCHIQKQVKPLKNGDRSIRIYDASDKLVLDLQTQAGLMSSDLFQIEIYDEIFRCPLTKFPIDELLKPKVWSTKSNKTDADIQKIVDSKQQVRFIGAPLQKYTTRIEASPESRIRQLGFNQKSNKWTGYYEGLSNRSGFHDTDFAQTKNRIALDNYRVIFLANTTITIITRIEGSFGHYAQIPCQNLLAVTKDHKVEVIMRSEGQHFLFSQNLSNSLQIDNFSLLKLAETQNWSNLRFTFQPKATKKTYGPFQGYIATIQTYYRLGFGTRYSGVFDWSKGYTFHKADEQDKAQIIIFDAVTAIKMFQGREDVLQEFTCRIATEYDPKMYMVRDGRDKQVGLFGNNTGGGQLVHIKLTQRKGRGEYQGMIFIDAAGGQCSTYLSGSNNLKWARQKRSDRKIIFRMRIKQE